MKKFLSLILALTLVASLFTVNVMAASKDHTATIALYDAEGNAITSAEVGDTVTVQITIDSTEGLKSVGYNLLYAADAFMAETTKVNRVEKCIDKPWLDDIKNTDGDWGYYLGNPTYNLAVDGSLKIAWAGSESVEADYNTPNRVIGKFYLVVEEGASGEYTFAFEENVANSYTTDDGKDMRLLSSNTATLKVGADAPVVPDEPEVTVPEAAADALTGGVAGNAGENYDNAAMTTATFTNIADIVKVGVLFIPTALLNGELTLDTADVANAEYAGELSALGEGSYTLKAALRGIPRKYHAGIGITSRAYAKYGDNAVKYADAKAGEITFAESAE